jgi:hypothetical protein
MTITPEMFAEHREPGPAFVPFTFHEHGLFRSLLWDYANLKWLRRGYVWRDATDYTAAGWVKP